MSVDLVANFFDDFDLFLRKGYRTFASKKNKEIEPFERYKAVPFEYKGVEPVERHRTDRAAHRELEPFERYKTAPFEYKEVEPVERHRIDRVVHRELEPVERSKAGNKGLGAVERHKVVEYKEDLSDMGATAHTPERGKERDIVVVEGYTVEGKIVPEDTLNHKPFGGDIAQKRVELAEVSSKVGKRGIVFADRPAGAWLNIPLAGLGYPKDPDKRKPVLSVVKF